MTSPLFALLRDDLSAAAFTVDALGALWGEDAAAALHRGHRLPARRALDRVAGGGRLGTLATLFILGLESTRERLDAALPRLGAEGAAQLGLVELEGDNARPVLDLRPYSFVDASGPGAWFIASDLGEMALGGAIPEHHVLGVGGASMTLSSLMLNEPAESVLDLGTGCGIQALHASRHARRVVATDISQRALDLAALNAALNVSRTSNFGSGVCLSPSRELFDHIVSNPPFVITPRAEGVPAYEYRDGGLVGDALVEQVVRESALHLNPGGVVQLLGNWEYRGGSDGLERVEGWLAGVGLDAWVIERETQDAALYAETWIRDGGTRPGTREFDSLYAAWLDDFEQRGVTSVGFGYLTLRAPIDGTVTVRRFERLDGQLGRNESGLGEHIAASLAAQGVEHGLSNDALARTRLVVAGDITEERYYWPGDEDPTVMDLRQGGGFGRTEPLGTALAAVVGASDGDLSVGAICAAIADLLGVDEAELLAEVLPSVRELLRTGFVRIHD